MSNAIIAQLSSDTIVAALNFTMEGSSPVLALCRKLIEGSTFASFTPMDVYRGDVLCLKVRSIGEAAKLEINGEVSTLPPRQPQPPGFVFVVRPVSVTLKCKRRCTTV